MCVNRLVTQSLAILVSNPETFTSTDGLVRKRLGYPLRILTVFTNLACWLLPGLMGRSWVRTVVPKPPTTMGCRPTSRYQSRRSIPPSSPPRPSGSPLPYKLRLMWIRTLQHSLSSPLSTVRGRKLQGPNPAPTT